MRFMLFLCGAHIYIFYIIDTKIEIYLHMFMYTCILMIMCLGRTQKHIVSVPVCHWITISHRLLNSIAELMYHSVKGTCLLNTCFIMRVEVIKIKVQEKDFAVV